jgi:hypothetical protein
VRAEAADEIRGVPGGVRGVGSAGGWPIRGGWLG